MLQSIAFIFFLIILLFYFLITATVLYHFHHYDVSPRRTRKLLTVFLTITLIFFVLDFVFYIRVPWQQISQNIGQFLHQSPHL